MASMVHVLHVSTRIRDGSIFNIRLFRLKEFKVKQGMKGVTENITLCQFQTELRHLPSDICKRPSSHVPIRMFPLSHHNMTSDTQWVVSRAEGKSYIRTSYGKLRDLR